MQKKKIYIEIQIPSQIRRRLAKKIELWSELPVKWGKEDNLHLTVSFVGYVDESVTPEICAKVSEAVENLESFDLELNKITLSPNVNDPRMVVLSGEPSSELGKLHEAVQNALGMKTEQYKSFSPKIILGKIRKEKWEQLSEKPLIDEKVQLILPVDYVSVMESKGGGAEYISLEDCPLA
jgi:RNA 2',3'-cyclic 3'-phosphodiesterase